MKIDFQWESRENAGFLFHLVLHNRAGDPPHWLEFNDRPGKKMKFFSD